MKNNKVKFEQAYGRSYLSEEEHEFAEQEIKDFCRDNDIKFMFYRTLKNAYHPMWREFKIEGPRNVLRRFDEEFCKFVNPRNN